MVWLKIVSALAEKAGKKKKKTSEDEDWFSILSKLAEAGGRFAEEKSKRTNTSSFLNPTNDNESYKQMLDQYQNTDQDIINNLFKDNWLQDSLR